MSLNRSQVEKCYVELERSLYNLSLRWVWDSEEAMDVVHDTFISVWQARNRINEETAKSYIYRTCINKSKNRIRSKKIRSFFGFFSDRSSDTHEDLEKRESILLLKEKIEQLPEKLKAVVLLSDLSELSYVEISEILEIPLGTVGSRRNEAMRLLKESFKKNSGEGL